MQTWNQCQWVINEAKRTSGEGELCGPGWLHWYSDPLLAVLHNPAHANFNARTMRLFEAWAGGKVLGGGEVKAGSTVLALKKEIPLPNITPAARVYYAVLVARAVIGGGGGSCNAWSEWADDFLAGKISARAEAAARAEAEAAAAEAAEFLAEQQEAAQARYERLRDRIISQAQAR